MCACMFIYTYIYIYIYIYICIYTNQHKSCLTAAAWLQTYTIGKAVLDTEMLQIFRIFESCEDFIICNLHICLYIYIILITEEFFKVAIESGPEY